MCCMQSSMLPGPSRTYCLAIDGYGACLAQMVRACRDNLEFHSLRTLIDEQLGAFNCSELLGRRLAAATAADTAERRTHRRQPTDATKPTVADTTTHQYNACIQERSTKDGVERRFCQVWCQGRRYALHICTSL